MTFRTLATATLAALLAACGSPESGNGADGVIVTTAATPPVATSGPPSGATISEADLAAAETRPIGDHDEETSAIVAAAQATGDTYAVGTVAGRKVAIRDEGQGRVVYRVTP